MLPKPAILVFDTSAAHCAAALLTPDGIVSRVDPMAKGQAEHLMPMLENLLAEAGLTWRDLGGIGVGIGPGNFTGIRISVAAARGLALGLKIPAIGVSGFDVINHLAPEADWAMIAAPRDMAYVQAREGTAALCPMAVVPPGAARASDFDADMSIRAMARVALAKSAHPTPRPAPLYVRPADAAPASDPPPVILP